MSHMLDDGGTTLTLPYLDWVDEYAWQPVEQHTDYSLTGALIVQQATRQAGRPITLAPPHDSMAWMRKSELEQLRVWAAIPGQRLTLTLDDGRQYDVLFRHGDALRAKPVLAGRAYPEADDDYWLVEIRLIEV